MKTLSIRARQDGCAGFHSVKTWAIELLHEVAAGQQNKTGQRHQDVSVGQQRNYLSIDLHTKNKITLDCFARVRKFTDLRPPRSCREQPTSLAASVTVHSNLRSSL